jgi:hypothetical protein
VHGWPVWSMLPEVQICVYFGEIIYNILFQAHFAARFCATKGHSDELYHFLGECHGTEGTLLAAWAIQSGP